mmetsp:Transcript_18981/g.44590  ORF Transcript_18981/g.44590 Transcript_18981/m.44590 type:complete len:83 (-) Transcript_18981:18-266(-)
MTATALTAELRKDGLPVTCEKPNGWCFEFVALAVVMIDWTVHNSDVIQNPLQWPVRARSFRLVYCSMIVWTVSATSTSKADD